MSRGESTEQGHLGPQLCPWLNLGSLDKPSVHCLTVKAQTTAPPALVATAPYTQQAPSVSCGWFPLLSPREKSLWVSHSQLSAWIPFPGRCGMLRYCVSSD